MNTTLKIINDGIHSFSLNFTAQTFVGITKIWIYMKINFPEDENDKNFRKEFIRTVINVEKALNGRSGNFLTNKIGESFMKSSNFELKFPLKKVS